MDKINIDDMVPVMDNDVFNEVIEEPTDVTTEDTVEEPTAEETADEVIFEEPTKETTEEPNEDDEESDDNNRVSTLFYEQLVEQGIASPQEGKEEYSWDDVNSVFDYYQSELPQEVAKSLVNSVPDVAKNLIDYVFTKGEELTQEDLTKFYNQHLAEQTEIVINDVDQAKEFLTAELSKVIGSQAGVRGAIESLEDEGDEKVIEEAQRIAKEVNAKRETVKVLNETKAKKQENIQAQRQFAQSVTEELQNTGWKPALIQEVKNDLSTQATWQTLSEITNSPKGVVQLAAMIRHWDKEKGSFNLETFVRKANSSESKSFKDKITEEVFNSQKDTKTAGKKSTKGTKSFLDSFTPIV